MWVGTVGRQIAVLGLQVQAHPDRVGRGAFLDHVRLGRRRVEVPRAEGVVVGDDRRAGVAVHDLGLGGVQRPFREESGLCVVIHEGLGAVAGLLGCDQSFQLRLRAVDVPARVGAVLGLLPSGHRVDLLVEAPVLPVAVAEQVRVQQRVVERGVEDLLLVGRATGDSDLAEYVVPRVVRGGPGCAEVPVRVLRPTVGCGSRDRDIRKADLGLHRAVAGRVERDRITPVERAATGERPVEDHVEVRGVGRRRRTEEARIHGAAHLGAAHLVEVQIGGLVSVQFEQEIGLRGRRECEARHAGACGRGQLGADPVVEVDRVRAGTCRFVAVREADGRVSVDAASGGQDGDVAHRAAAGPGDVVETEPGDNVVRICVIAAGRTGGRVGAPRDHAERGIGSGEGVAPVGSAQQRIDQGGGVGHRSRRGGVRGSSRGGESQEEQTGREKSAPSFHRCDSRYGQHGCHRTGGGESPKAKGTATTLVNANDRNQEQTPTDVGAKGVAPSTSDDTGRRATERSPAGHPSSL